MAGWATELIWMLWRTEKPVAHAGNQITFPWSFTTLIILAQLPSLTPCRWATQKCVIAIPRVVDGSRISTFSYTTSCTCISQMVWLSFRFKVIDSLMQDACVSSYK